MQITDHFSLLELTRSSTATRLGLDNTIPEELMPNALRVAEALEKIRAHFGKSIHVTSCYRAPEVNKAVGGSPTSAHRFASAADFEVDGVPNIEVCKAIPEILDDYDQIIYEFGPTGWVHLGFAQTPRHQKLSATKQNGKTVYSPGFQG